MELWTIHRVDCICETAANKEVDELTCNWIKTMLQSRTIKTKLAQGGMLFPRLWSLVEEDIPSGKVF